MIKLPPHFIRQFDSKTLATINTWWTQLTPTQQQEVAQMYADIDPIKFSEDQLEFISLEMYEPYQQEVRSKRKEWMHNEHWLSGFTEYVINQDTYFIGALPLYIETSTHYQNLLGSTKTPEQLTTRSFIYYLDDIYHVQQLNVHAKWSD